MDIWSFQNFGYICNQISDKTKTMKSMKTRFLMLLAAVLLGGASVMAQSGNGGQERGDVNGDGSVDVFDIVELANIIMNQGKTSEAKKYVYVGQTDPANVTFSSLTSSSAQIIQEVTSKTQIKFELRGSTRDYWYACAPNDLGYEMYDSSGTISAESMDSYTISKDGITYKVWKTAVKSLAIAQTLK